MMIMRVSLFPTNLSHRRIPFVLRNGVKLCCCTKDRDYSSGFPVRYVPKRVREAQELKLSESSDMGKRENLSPFESSAFSLSASSGVREREIPVQNEKRQFWQRNKDFQIDDSDWDDELEAPVRCDAPARVAAETSESSSLKDLWKKRIFTPPHKTELKFTESNGVNNIPISVPKIQCLQHIKDLTQVDDHQDDELEVQEDDFGKELEDVEESEIPNKLNVHGVPKSKKDAGMVAVKLLAARAYTAVELRKKLLKRGYTVYTVDTVIREFTNRGLINDSLYAEGYSRSRWSSSTWGPKRIKQALSAKGVKVVDMEKAVNLVFREGESDDDETSKFGLSKASMDHLYTQASKQWVRGQDASFETRKSRIVRWLQYRGFNWGVISFILKKLESQKIRD